MHPFAIAHEKEAQICDDVRVSLPTILGPPLIVRHVRVDPKDASYVKGIVEASEGLAIASSDVAGELLIATTPEQLDELDRLLSDLSAEMNLLEASEAITGGRCPPP